MAHSAAVFYGNLNAAFAPKEDDTDGVELPLGFGTEAELISWARGLQRDSDRFCRGKLFPKDRDIIGIWIVVLPTVEGRIPWEDEKAIPRILLLEGEVPDWALEEYVDFDFEVVIQRVPLLN